MKFRTITTRAAVAGATTALAAGAFVAVAAPANAATVTDTYTCTMTGVYQGDFAMEVSGDLPVPQYWAGAAVPAGLVNLTATATVPADAAGLLAGVGVTGAKSDDYALSLGDRPVPIPISGDFVTEGETTTWEASGTNLDFVTANPGTVDGFLPETFTLLPTKEDGSTFGSLTCVVTDGDPAEIVTDFVLLRQSSATTAKNVTVKKGKAAIVPVKVESTSLSVPVTGGKVVAKQGTKTLDTAKVKDGKAKLNLGKKLKVGKHKITVKYLGIPSVGGSKDNATVTVKK